MLGIFRLMGIVVALCLSPVTGIQFTMSSNQVDPTNPPQATLWMNCTAAFLTDVDSLFIIKIERVSSSSTEPWELIATGTNSGVGISKDLSSYWQAAQVSGSIYPGTGGDHPVTDSYLNVGVDASSLTCFDASTYRCEMRYFTTSLNDETDPQNSSLTITAQPSTPDLTAKHENTNEVFYNVGSSSDNPADMDTGEQLVISCTADIGSDSSRTIQWRKSSEVGTGGMILYNGNVDEGTATPIPPSDCRYTRTSTMRYNTTVFDANRDSANQLRFLCIVNGAPSDRNRTFYVRVVTGIRFTMSSNQVDPTNPPQAILWMNCTAAFLTDVNSLFYIKIVRESSSSTDPWQLIATVTNEGVVTATTDLPSNWQAAEVSGSIYPSIDQPTTPITDSYINVGVFASSLTCSDARTYRCELQYLSSATLEIKPDGQNSSLTITAQPSTPDLTAKHENTNEVFYNVGSSSDNPADMDTGEQLEISCTADIGSDSSRTIQWRKSSEVGTGGMILYNGNVDEGTATPITASGCRYTRTSTILYNTTVFDANRASANNLRFLCIVNGAPTDRNRTFYVRVDGVPTRDDDLGGPVNTDLGVIGASVGSVLAIVIIVIVIVFVVRRLQIRNNTNNGRKESMTLEHTQRLPTLATQNVDPVNAMSLSERNESTQYEELHKYEDVSDNYSSICQERGQTDNSTGVYINTTLTL